MKYKTLLKSFSVPITSALCLSAISCKDDSTKIKESFNKYRTSLENVYKNNDKFSRYILSNENKDLSAILIDNLFLNDLIVLKNEIEQGRDKDNFLNRSDVLINIIEQDGSISEFNQEKSKFNEIVDNIKNNSQQYNDVIKSVILNLLTSITQYFNDIEKLNSRSFLNFINQRLKVLYEYTQSQELNKIVSSFNNYDKLSKQFNYYKKEIMEDLNNKFNSHFIFKDNFEHLCEFGEKYNNLNKYGSDIYKNIQFNLPYIAFKYFFIKNSEEFNYLNNSKKWTNEETSKIMNKLTDIIENNYRSKYDYLAKVHNEFKNFVFFMDRIGPQDYTNIKKLGLIDTMKQWTSNFDKTEDAFLVWFTKLENKEPISYKENFKSDLTYEMSLDNKKIIFRNTYESAAKNYSNW
ncbi:hypothetical protein [Mycoplasma zalophidermidis]|uniref:Lipoprotein n=1 Tax=Mycoplasma zalophidermidis TaxID=398174 RepID=A0ABS6DS76_9MOLU|nr:hypothetical protein [Mycoplasma zalophidermidis]MBU4689995.1 hypothetical protein [Mycoplasma zalophidermidis]MBU4693851.1 hypothetical protein [Mycoplasma zalophidermidis]MCR8966842.1 hypothetical protein [Mycoplasma zalophidermidis]